MSSDVDTIAPASIERKATRKERRLVWLFAILPIVFLLGLGGYALLVRTSTPSKPKPPPLRAGMEAPAFTYPDMEGKQISLKDFRGKVVFINVWATWCPTCTWEMPSMQAIYQKYRDQGLVMLAVSIDVLGKEIVAPYMKKYGLTFPALLDPKGTIKRMYQTTGVPETFIVDRDGRIFRKIIGPREWTDPQMVQMIEAALRSS